MLGGEDSFPCLLNYSQISLGFPGPQSRVGAQEPSSETVCHICLLFNLYCLLSSSLWFSCQVMSDSYWLHRLHHARLPCSLPSPRICPSSCPLNRWCHPTNSSSVTLFFFYVQSFPASGSFPMSQLFTLGGQCIGASASASVLPKCIWGWFPLRLTGLISLVPKGLSRVFYSTTVWKHQFYSTLPSLLSVQLLHAYMTTGMRIALTIQTSVGKVMFLLLTHCLGLSWLSCQEAIVL